MPETIASDSPPAFGPRRPPWWLNFFCLIALLVLGLTFLHYLERRNFVGPDLYPRLLKPAEFASVGEMWDNLELALQGYRGGYFRSAAGYAVFILQAIFFFGLGGLALGAILGRAGPDPDPDPPSMPEALALRYLLGSGIASLVWLLLGTVGLLNTALAWTAAAAGLGIFIAQSAGPGELKRRLTSIPGRLQNGVSKLTLLEKILAFLAAAILLSLTTFSVPPQSGEDTLLANLSLPYYYAYLGRVAADPFHIGTYASQNTEMLNLWALLLGSETACVLQIWGFLAAWMVLVFGFIRRYTSSFTALAAVVFLLSVPLLVFQSVRVRSDVPSAVFLFAHYLALLEALRRREALPEGARRWALLSGILCGAAAGHRALAISSACFSLLSLLAGDWIAKKKGGRPLLWIWSAGALASFLPWALRAILLTGNPIYPHLSGWIGGEPLYPWHRSAHDFLARHKWEGAGFLSPLLFSQQRECVWGPSALFLLAAPNLLRRKLAGSFGLCTLAAAASSIAFLILAFDPRFQIGTLAWLTVVPFAFGLEAFLQGPWRGLRSWAVSLLTCGCLFYLYSYSTIAGVLRASWAIALSGYAQGNFSTPSRPLDQWLWIAHFINTRTRPTDTVLCFEKASASGLKRRIFFSSGGPLDQKTMIGDLSERSADGRGLRDQLAALGVDHVVASADFYNEFKNSPGHARIAEPDLLKILDLFKNHMVMRMSSPDYGLLWLSFRSQKIDYVQLNEDDAMEHPLAFLEAARAFLARGDARTAEGMAHMLAAVPKTRANRIDAYEFLASIYSAIGDEPKYEQTLLYLVAKVPDYPEGHFQLALLYDRAREFSKSMEHYRRAIALRPDYTEAHNNLGNVYFQVQAYEKALASYKEAVAINSSYHEAWNNIGNVHYASGNYAEAQQYYLKAVSLNPYYAVAYCNLGLIYANRGRDAEAFQFYRKAIVVDPRYRLAYQNLAHLHRRRKETSEADKVMEAYGRLR